MRPRTTSRLRWATLRARRQGRSGAAVLVLIMIFVASLAACASGARSLNMVPEALTPERTHPYTVRVSAAGGSETKAWWGSQISDDALVEALARSLERSEVFAKVVADDEADYLLDVFIEDVRQPFISINMTVTVVARWTLMHRATGAIVHQAVISTRSTATIADALVGAERLRAANEGAARANIKKGLRKLSRLEL